MSGTSSLQRKTSFGVPVRTTKENDGSNLGNPLRTEMLENAFKILRKRYGGGNKLTDQEVEPRVTH